MPNLHHLEEKLMVSPLKKLMLSYFELNIFKYLMRFINFDLNNKVILEVGCGAGFGIEYISKSFSPLEYYAFDKNKKMVLLSIAKARKLKLKTQIFLGDARKIKLESSKFDIVFIFTVLHHIIEWREVLKEVNNVLKPKGLLLVNEINNRSLNWFERYLRIYHPKNSRFTWPTFRKGLLHANFYILKEFYFLEDFGFFLCVKK